MRGHLHKIITYKIQDILTEFVSFIQHFEISETSIILYNSISILSGLPQASIGLCSYVFRIVILGFLYLICKLKTMF